MNIKNAVLKVAAVLITFAAMAAAGQSPPKPGADSPDGTNPNTPGAVGGFGSGTGMGPGGATGSASSPMGGLNSPAGSSGAATQSFGGGFINQPQTMGSGPLSIKPSSGMGANSSGASK